MSQQTLLLNGNASPDPERTVRRSWRLRFLRAFTEYLPTAIVLTLLAAVGIFGHRNGWRLPRSSAILAQPQETTVAWCLEHGVPEAQCVECRPTLLPKPTDHGWCTEHGISQCTLCHPEIAQLATPVPTTEADLRRSKRALEARPRAENNSRCILYRRRIQFASHDAVRKVGLDVEPVDRAPIDEVIVTNGAITFDRTRLAQLSSKSSGTAWRVLAKVGDQVATGDLLALVDAADVGRVKTEFLDAIARWEFASATKDRLQPVSGNGAVAASRLLEVDASIRETRSRILLAQQTMTNLGLPVSVEEFRGRTPDQISADLQYRGLPSIVTAEFDRKTTTSNLLPLSAPFEGVIVAADVVAGEFVDTSKPLFKLADTQRMWLTLDVPLEETAFVRIDQLVRFQPSGGGQAVEGRIEWISAEADPQTRTVKVRAVLKNADGALRDQTFGRGEIVLRRDKDAIVIPNDALQWDGSCHVVFVRDRGYFSSEDAPKLFYPRPVRVGARTEQLVEIIAGVLPGEIVVTKGSGVLRGELLKNNLGAG